MGMKIRQASKVKTFFKKIFKISKKKGKDGIWRRMDKDVLYKLSRESGLDSLSSTTDGLNTSRTGLDYNVETADSKIPLTSFESIKDNNMKELSQNSQPKPTKTNEHKKAKVHNNKGEKSLKGSPKDRVTVDRVVKDKSTKKKKNKQYSELLDDSNPDIECDPDKQDTDLLDIDFNLVLSSFPNIRTPSLGKYPTAEAEDNVRNEQRSRQESPLSGSRHEVEVIIETPRTSPVVPGHKRDHLNEEVEKEDDLDSTAQVWERLVIESDRIDVSPLPVKKNKKKNKKNKNKKNDSPDHVDNTIEENHPVPETTKLVTTKRKGKKRNKKGKKFEVKDEVESQLSTEKLLCEDESTDRNNDSMEDTDKVEKRTDPLSDTFTDSLTTREPKKKNKRNKRRANVRRPEDDLEADLLPERASRRQKHQTLWSSEEIITELESPETHQENHPGTGKKSKKMRRRRLKLKYNKEKKRLQFKKYDELDGPAEIENLTEVKQDRPSGAREVGRRMWRACKSGWKYLRAGLVFYSKTPGAGLSFTPAVQRYDEHGQEHFASI